MNCPWKESSVDQFVSDQYLITNRPCDQCTLCQYTGNQLSVNQFADNELTFWQLWPFIDKVMTNWLCDETVIDQFTGWLIAHHSNYCWLAKAPAYGQALIMSPVSINNQTLFSWFVTLIYYHHYIPLSICYQTMFSTFLTAPCWVSSLRLDLWFQVALVRLPLIPVRS